MGVLLHSPRTATCVAYDHPLDDPSRKPGRVELVRIAAEDFEQVLLSSPVLRERIDRIVAERRQRDVTAATVRPWHADSPLTALPDYSRLGLVQGQKLLLIDLDLCTRCGDCVRACVNTHDDGYTRLFLDGPRFDRFLVPSACRNCLNPSCMIGCPVGSIQRGDNGEIVIRDWCVGCGLCARQCPYDSIQMHDLGLIAETSSAWRIEPAPAVRNGAWHQPKQRDANWCEAAAPFSWNLDLQSKLVGRSPSIGAAQLAEPVYFRHAFDVPADRRAASTFKLSLASKGSSVEVWVNGRAIAFEQDAKQKKKGEYEAVLPLDIVKSGGNVVAVCVHPPVEENDLVLSLRLDMFPNLVEAPPGVEAAELKAVTQRAVVCDLCSTLADQEPACVAQCPHNAAFRVDARFEFPTR
jgi:Fe-S-cluster-containing hydrogenase component 2